MPASFVEYYILIGILIARYLLLSDWNPSRYSYLFLLQRLTFIHEGYCINLYMYLLIFSVLFVYRIKYMQVYVEVFEVLKPALPMYGLI